MSRPLAHAEIETIRRLNGRGLNDQEIAREIGRGRTAVVRYRVGMGLAARSIHNPDSQARRLRSRRLTFEREARAHGNYAALVNQVRAASIGWLGVPLMVACLLATLREGSLETPEIIRRMGAMRLERNWRPTKISTNRAHKTLGEGMSLGLVTRIRRGTGGRPRGRVGSPGIYGLSDLAERQLRSPRRGLVLDTWAALAQGPGPDDLDRQPAQVAGAPRA